MAKGKGSRQADTPVARFHASLALAKWALKIVQGQALEPLRELNQAKYEGIDGETGHTKFFLAAVGSQLFTFDDARLSRDKLAEYDKRIVGYWNEIAAGRKDDGGNPPRMKYFQWLSLVVTELYLDWYFGRRGQLLGELNAEIAAVNETLPKKSQLDAVSEDDLSKIAFWEATGAGKTLLLHVNILQYRWHANQVNAKFDRVILLTPNEGLTRQHLEELRLSGIKAEPLTDDGGLFQQDADTVGVIDAGKLISDEGKRKKGEKSMLAAAFEGKNLVLVDEGHHGSSSEDGEHRKVRDMLCKDGFSFEYSATFGQAVAKGLDTKLWNLYARNILFDYSYKYFFEDGYGKEAFILNQPDAAGDDQLFRYLSAGLLAYYRQHRIFAEHPVEMAEYGIEKPLCVFVGNTVSGKKGEEESDLLDVIRFLARAVSPAHRGELEGLFQNYVADKTVLAVGGADPFKGMFAELMGVGADVLYSDMRAKIFNAADGGRLTVQHRTRTGEIVLRVGEQGRVFGVVSIGDPAGFVKLLDAQPEGAAREYDLLPSDDIGDESAFAAINAKDSPITFLIGSRKFTEGWSSWRVSTMGLLNMGVNEGTQIIQLFGRGVRLKGKGFSLKRSARLDGGRPQEQGYLRRLETLNIFGVRANYMAKFREYLEAEGVRTLDQVPTLDFKVRWKPIPPEFLVPALGEGYGLGEPNGFKAKAKVSLFDIQEAAKGKIKEPKAVIRDFGQLQMLENRDDRGESGVKNETWKPVCLDHRAYPFFDWDGIYLRLLGEKARLGYRNLAISKDRLVQFANAGDDWYELYTRPEDVTFDTFAKLSSIQALFERLLAKYMEAFYKKLQNFYESTHYEMTKLTETSFPENYHFTFGNEDGADDWLKRLAKLAEVVSKDGVTQEQVDKWSRDGSSQLVALLVNEHLYYPLIYKEKDATVPFTMEPCSIGAESELNFLKGFMAFAGKNSKFFAEKKVYLFRNPSNNTKGVGFAQAADFYPDFLLWIIDEAAGKYSLCFIDPKGLRNYSLDHPKLAFCKTVKDLQNSINAKEGKTKTTLGSVILSATETAKLTGLFGSTKADYERQNVFFLEEGEDVYMPKVLKAMSFDCDSPTMQGA